MKKFLSLLFVVMCAVAAHAQEDKVGSGIGVYDLSRTAPEETAVTHEVQVDTVGKQRAVAPLVSSVEVDGNNQLVFTGDSALEKVEVMRADSTVVDTFMLNGAKQGSIDLNKLPKETLHFKFYGVGRESMTIDLER